MNRIATAAPPAALTLWLCSTAHSVPASIAKQRHMSVMHAKSSLRRPTVSMRNQGMKEATKNQVKRPPATRDALCRSSPAARTRLVLMKQEKRGHR